MPSSTQPTAAPISPGMRRPEELGRIRHADEAGRGHLEDAELVRRPEAVLRRPQDAVLVVAVALELEHAVDEVLEHARAGDGAVLRHVPDEDRRDARLLRDPQEPAGRLAHLRDGSGSRAERRRVQRLHRVDRRRRPDARCSSVAHTASSSVSARMSTASAPPSRAARSDTCAADSSPVTSSARRPLRAIAPSDVSRSVDLPTPAHRRRGRREAGTSPPPSTRSSSGTAVVMRCASFAATSPSGTGVARRAAAGSRAGRDELLDERPERAAARALAEPARAPSSRTPCTREWVGGLRHGASLGAASDANRHESARFRLQVGRWCLRVPVTPRDDLERTGRMDRFNALGRGTQIMAVSALLLFIRPLPAWQDFDVGGLADESASMRRWSGWHGFAGVVLGLLTVILLAWLIVRLAAVNIPVPVSTAMTAAVLGMLILHLRGDQAADHPRRRADDLGMDRARTGDPGRSRRVQDRARSRRRRHAEERGSSLGVIIGRSSSRAEPQRSRS